MGGLPATEDGVEDQLCAKLAEAAQTYSKDVGVLGWYPMQNVSDSRKWTIVERYDQESTVAKHREYPGYKTCIQKCSAYVGCEEQRHQPVH
ncbi:hypothetical protein PC123_g22826 [Phytophthora cactorum]|nr:hypothetical protein PC123_g22826 [Phytophthora cactorum]